MDAAGFNVTREYYINDAGTQMDAFYRSVFARYMQAQGQEAEMPSNGYVGDYILDLAGEILASEGARFAHMDEEQGVKEIGNLAREKMVDLIRADLSLIGVEFDNWFSEGTLFQHGEYDKALELLRENNYLSQRNGALGFNSSVMGSSESFKNRVSSWTALRGTIACRGLSTAVGKEM